MTGMARFRCPTCGTVYPSDRPRWRCDCGGPLDLEPGPGLRRPDIAAADASLWRYRAALALKRPPQVSLGEGWTPLVARDWDGVPVHFKLESQMPTGSFKDRGAAAA
jgi:threonine synthase